MTETKRKAISWRLRKTMSSTNVGNAMNNKALATPSRRPNMRQDISNRATGAAANISGKSTL